MPGEGYKRKLTAVFSADAVGYSRLMGEDEAATVRTLEAYKQIMFSLVEQHRGRVVDSPGDNLLAEFASVVDAVQCGVAVQNEFRARNVDLPENRKMHFRIGINLGDVIEEGDRIYGDGVNIAARLEALADPGGICVSKTAFDHIESKLPLGYEFLGDQKVKNIAKPVGAYRVLMEPRVTVAGVTRKQESAPFPGRKAILVVSTVLTLLVIAALIWSFSFQRSSKQMASVERMAFPLPDKPSIAVLPFDNLSGDPKQEYFSDGITEEITTALSKIPKLFVVARNSTFTYKGKAVWVPTVGKELGVKYVLEGSVRKAGDEVRVTAQLIDAPTNHHIWAERYDRDLKDIFAVQDEITKKIITALQVKVTEGEQASIYARGTANLDAYLKAMEANWLYMHSTKDGVLKARKLAEEAITLDPQYAFAYKILGSTHGVAIQLGMSKNPPESLKLAIELHKKAIELDDSFALAHAGLGFWSLYARQYDTAIAQGKRAFELQPSSADTIIGYAGILTFAGRPEEAISLYREALRLNPKPPTVYYRFFGIALKDSGQYEEAIAQAKKATEQEPNDLISLALLTSSYSLAGRDEEARATAKEVLRISPNFSVGRFEKISPHKDHAVAKRYCDALRKAGLPE